MTTKTGLFLLLLSGINIVYVLMTSGTNLIYNCSHFIQQVIYIQNLICFVSALPFLITASCFAVIKLVFVSINVVSPRLYVWINRKILWLFTSFLEIRDLIKKYNFIIVFKILITFYNFLNLIIIYNDCIVTSCINIVYFF